MATSERPRLPAARSRAPIRARTSSIAAPREAPFARVGDVLGARAFWLALVSKVSALAVLLAAGALLYHLTVTRTYYVSELVVEGNRLLATQEIADTAGVSGLHILWINGRQVAQRLLALPAVETVEVQPLFPRRVAIHVVERVPAAQWQVGSGSLLVDREGRVIGPAPRGETLVTVRESRSTALEPGEHVPADAVRAARELSALLPAAWQPADGVYEYAANTGISLVTRAGWRVRFGDDQDLEWKLATFEALAQEIQRTNTRVQLVDVRFVGRPYYR